jgi:hypothetical protein
MAERVPVNVHEPTEATFATVHSRKCSGEPVVVERLAVFLVVGHPTGLPAQWSLDQPRFQVRPTRIESGQADSLARWDDPPLFEIVA